MAIPYRIGRLCPTPADPTVAAEEYTNPFRLDLPALLREEWRLRRRCLGTPRPGPAIAHRLAAVEAALRAEGLE